MYSHESGTIFNFSPISTHKLSAKLPQMKFTCDSSSIDEEVNCNCFSPCNEVIYDAEMIISNYQKDEIEKTNTEKYEE